MSVSVIWIDESAAKLFHFSQEKMQRDHFNTHPEAGMSSPSADFKQLVALHLKDIKCIVLAGPDLRDPPSREAFRQYLEAHHPQTAQYVVSSEPLNAPSDAEIASLALKFFYKAPRSNNRTNGGSI